MKPKLNNRLKIMNSYFSKQLLLVAFFLFSVNCMKAQTPTGTCNIIQQPCNGNGVMTTTISGSVTLPLTFTYYAYDASPISHSNINSIIDTLKGITNPISYIYVTDVNGGIVCIIWSNSIGMLAPFQIDNPIITNAICPSLTGSAELTINGGTAPASVQWFEHINYNSHGTYIGTGNPMNLTPGFYSALVTDVNGCYLFYGTDSSEIDVQNISPVTFSISTTDAGCTNGTANVNSPSGGIAPYTYQWFNGANSSSINNLVQGNYYVTVTDAQGCKNSSSFYVQQSPLITVHTTPTPATCLQNDGKVIAFGSGGTPPYTYLYSTGFAGQTATGLSGDSLISVTVTDAKGCTGTDWVYVSTSTPITVTYSTVKSSCTASTGSATLNINGGTPPYLIDWNTFPKQTNISISNMPPGFYSFKVSDAAGCIRTGVAVIEQQSTINANAYSANPVCPATTGNVYVNVSGSDPPFTFLWNTGATTATISNVSSGSYSCIITDKAGCTVTKYEGIYSTSPININITTTPASCMYANDGSSYANPIGGTAPYAYLWSDGQTTPTATNLKSGNYYVSVKDVNGCTQIIPPLNTCSCFGPKPFDKYTFVDFDSTNDNCYCTLKGKVYVDQNNNCQYDAGEQGIEHSMVHCSTFGYGFTDANGDYSFKVPSGSYTLSESVQYVYPLASCQNNSIAVNVTAASGCVSTVNFANAINPIHDLHIYKTCMHPPIPGNSYYDKLIVQNDGTVTESNIQSGYAHDGQLQYYNTTPISFTQLNSISEPNWYSINSGFPTLDPGAATILTTQYSVPTNIPLGTEVNFWDTATFISPMSSWLNDYTPWNNLENYKATVVGSYDPNFKEVSPKGFGPEGNISPDDTVLDYIIHFQNTGSYYAQNVVLTDTLDTDLNWESLRLGYSDHNYTANITESGVLKFTFNNINLDWQANNDINSRALVAYSIKLKSNLIPGTKIKNSAAIYFDYNAPVITNTTVNTIQIAAGVNEKANSTSDVTVYPNPFSSITTIAYSVKQDATVELNVINLLGQQIALIDGGNKTSGNHSIQWNAENIAPGIYVLVLKVNDQVSTKKLIVTQ
jgi:uncharacterized repeat protein (TIGR01451 family)